MISPIFAYRVALLALGTAIAIFILELGVRVVHPQPPLLYTPDPVLGWVHRKITVKYPGANGVVTVQFNSRGLRDTEHPYKKQLGVRRILILGDSYPEAADVELQDSFGKQLESILNRSSGVRYEVINSGVGGYGTDQEYLYLKNEGWKYQPDVVMLMFTIANDVHDNMVKQYCRLSAAEVACVAPDPGTGRRVIIAAKAFLQDHFESYFALENLSERIYPARLLLSKVGLTEFKDANDLRKELPPELRLIMREPGADLDEGWRLTTGILQQIAQEATAHDARFILLIVPANSQINAGPLQAQWRKYGVPDETVDLDRPNRILHEFANTNAIPVIDVLPEFRAAVEMGRKVINGHWTAEGHTLAAEKAAVAVTN